MPRRAAFALLCAWTLTAVGPAFGDSHEIPVSISEGPLPSGLQNLERQTGIELLFDHSLVNGFRSPAVHGKLTTEAALRQLLAGTNLLVRRAESGAWIVEPPVGPPLAQPDAVVPEILITGQRTQNADIRRFDNDIQPYTIATQAQIVDEHRDDIEQYFTSFITSNTQGPAGSLAPSGNTLSAINLRGLGPQDTLVLIDGRRMPSVPNGASGFGQSDLNAIPLHAIERIEVLTGAAGGIYGFGALGGVVNVVLDRNSRGLDVHVTEGISSHGDAERHALEASFGTTSQDGRTDLALFAAHSQSNSVLAGERDFATRDREVTAELDPQLYLSPYPPPHGNSVSVFSLTSANLTFKPGFGGATLPSDHTFLPVGFSGNAAALTSSLTQHAGELDFSLDANDANSDLGSNPRSDALLFNLRHKFDVGVQTYIDALVLRSHGESRNAAFGGQAFETANSPANPFNNDIVVSFPIEGMELQASKRVESTRYTAGLMADLPLDWRGTADASFGAFRYSASVTTDLPGPGAFLFLGGAPSDLNTNPLGNWDAFQRAAAAGHGRYSTNYEFHTQFRDQSLRLAGPLFSTPAGPTTLTLLAERRTEHVPAYTDFSTTLSDGSTTTSDSPTASQSNTTTSLYAEIRSRVFAHAAPAPFLQGLEFQLAVRRDDQKDTFARNGDVASLDLARARFVGTAYTAGAKISPTPWLMLRGSYATGQVPPPVDTLQEDSPVTLTAPIATDPKRGGENLGVDGAYVVKAGGNPNLHAVRATTMFLGAVLTPLGEDGPRLAVDFSHIRKTDDVLIPTSFEFILAHEDSWPQRVTRGPLTLADRAKGYTVGPVTLLDATVFNGATLNVDALDMHAQWPLALLYGRVRLYADATYHMHNVEGGLFQPDVESAGYREGPLKWRANGGIDWSRDQLTIGANVQYFGHYLIFKPGQPAFEEENEAQIQGSSRVPSQTYLDLHTTWRIPVRDKGPLHDLTLDFGVINVLDAAPPRESSLITLMGPGYSQYGDPRQRRFELVVSGHF